VDICLLQPCEVGRWRNYGILPNHEDHLHIPAKEGMQGLKDEIYEIVEGPKGRHYLTYSKTYVLEYKRSGGKYGIPVLQRVVGTQLARYTPPRERNH
jgi:hypothetical protein